MSEERENFYPKKEVGIDIPDFINKGNTLTTEETQKQIAILNNVPNNKTIEDENHLNELETVAQNWSEAEWERVIIHAKSHLMTTELDRRLEFSEKYIANTRANLEILAGQKL